MKKLSDLITKLIAKAQENPQATMKFGIFLVILVLAFAYPTAFAIVGTLACMIAIQQRSKAKESLDFLNVPVEMGKIVAKDAKDAVEAKKTEMAAAKAAKAEAKSEVKAKE